MSPVAAVALAVVAVVLGGWGLGSVCYKQGYVHGFEDGAHPEETAFTPED